MSGSYIVPAATESELERDWGGGWATLEATRQHELPGGYIMTVYWAGSDIAQKLFSADSVAKDVLALLTRDTRAITDDPPRPHRAVPLRSIPHMQWLSYWLWRACVLPSNAKRTHRWFWPDSEGHVYGYASRLRVQPGIAFEGTMFTPTAGDPFYLLGEAYEEGECLIELSWTQQTVYITTQYPRSLAGHMLHLLIRRGRCSAYILDENISRSHHPSPDPPPSRTVIMDMIDTTVPPRPFAMNRQSHQDAYVIASMALLMCWSIRQITYSAPPPPPTQVTHHWAGVLPSGYAVAVAKERPSVGLARSRPEWAGGYDGIISPTIIEGYLRRPARENVTEVVYMGVRLRGGLKVTKDPDRVYFLGPEGWILAADESDVYFGEPLSGGYRRYDACSWTGIFSGGHSVTCPFHPAGVALVEDLRRNQDRYWFWGGESWPLVPIIDPEWEDAELVLIEPIPGMAYQPNGDDPILLHAPTTLDRGPFVTRAGQIRVPYDDTRGYADIQMSAPGYAITGPHGEPGDRYYLATWAGPGVNPPHDAHYTIDYLALDERERVWTVTEYVDDEAARAAWVASISALAGQWARAGGSAYDLPPMYIVEAVGYPVIQQRVVTYSRP